MRFRLSLRGRLILICLLLIIIIIMIGGGLGGGSFGLLCGGSGIFRGYRMLDLVDECCDYYSFSGSVWVLLPGGLGEVEFGVDGYRWVVMGVVRGTRDFEALFGVRGWDECYRSLWRCRELSGGGEVWEWDYVGC